MYVDFLPKTSKKTKVIDRTLIKRGYQGRLAHDHYTLHWDHAVLHIALSMHRGSAGREGIRLKKH